MDFSGETLSCAHSEAQPPSILWLYHPLSSRGPQHSVSTVEKRKEIVHERVLGTKHENSTSHYGHFTLDRAKHMTTLSCREI